MTDGGNLDSWDMVRILLYLHLGPFNVGYSGYFTMDETRTCIVNIVIFYSVSVSSINIESNDTA